MGEAKIEFKAGDVSFSGEGDGKWLSEQLDKLLGKISELAKVSLSHAGHAGHAVSAPTQPASPKTEGTLASFLKEKASSSNQNRKFLATAVWLEDGMSVKRPLTTRDVTMALSENRQVKLGNASQSLNDNVKQGLCQKEGKKGFFVTDEGRNSLG